MLPRHRRERGGYALPSSAKKQTRQARQRNRSLEKNNIPRKHCTNTHLRGTRLAAARVRYREAKSTAQESQPMGRVAPRLCQRAQRCLWLGSFSLVPRCEYGKGVQRSIRDERIGVCDFRVFTREVCLK